MEADAGQVDGLLDRTSGRISLDTVVTIYAPILLPNTTTQDIASSNFQREIKILEDVIIQNSIDARRRPEAFDATTVQRILLAAGERLVTGTSLMWINLFLDKKQTGTAEFNCK